MPPAYPFCSKTTKSIQGCAHQAVRGLSEKREGLQSATMGAENRKMQPGLGKRDGLGKCVWLKVTVRFTVPGWLGQGRGKAGGGNRPQGSWEGDESEGKQERGAREKKRSKTEMENKRGEAREDKQENWDRKKGEGGKGGVLGHVFFEYLLQNAGRIHLTCSKQDTGEPRKTRVNANNLFRKQKLMKANVF